MKIETLHGKPMKAVALLDTQCQSGNWISLRLVERLGLTDHITKNTNIPVLRSGTGQDVESLGELEIEWRWYPNGVRMYHALFFVFKEGSHLDIIIGVEFIVREDLVRANMPAFVPLVEHQKTTKGKSEYIRLNTHV